MGTRQKCPLSLQLFNSAESADHCNKVRKGILIRKKLRRWPLFAGAAIVYLENFEDLQKLLELIT